MSRNKSELQTSERPEYHFSLTWNHILFPSGLIYIKGIYHLFLFKKSVHSPDALAEWTQIQSKDLLNWTDEQVIQSDPKKGTVYSGYVVHDTKNSSGLGSGSKPPLIAIFNHVNNEPHFYLSYSKDGGHVWTPYGKGPVLDNKKPRSRDPFIFWHGSSGKWIMLITIPQEYKVLFYSSKNLIRWELISDFGGHPSFNKKWSHASLLPCRSKTPLEITKWILMIGLSEGENSNRYFVGEFDGKSFKCDHALDAMLKIDHGKDFYAPYSLYYAPGSGQYRDRSNVTS
jgi:sucrose-6-phosphate hydrolase SacC (GH32 family)